MSTIGGRLFVGIMLILLPSLGWSFNLSSMSNSTHAHTDMRRKTEFLNLKQGSMSVLEYEHKFNDLSRFAPKLIPNEEGSMSVDDLRKEISASLARWRDMSSFGGPSQGPSKRYGSSSNSTGSGWSGGRGSSSGSGRSGPMPTWSQNSDQQSVVITSRDSSWQTSSACHNCGQIGRFMRDCPHLMQSSGPSQRGSTSCFYCD
ncbi:unnamed protein product [Prunus armeniaca]